MISYIITESNEISKLFEELIFSWKPFLSKEVSVSVNQYRTFVSKKTCITIDFIYESDVSSEKKFIEYESRSEKLYPGILKYYKGSDGMDQIDLFYCDNLSEIRRALYELQFTKSYQKMLIKYVS